MATGYILVDAPNPYTAQGTYPRRGGARLSGTCIVHTSEGNWQAGVNSLTNLVRTRSDYGCYHRACDWEDIALYYPWEWETWQDTETNNWAAGIAAACKTTDWTTMPADVREGYYRNLGIMAADFVTYMRDQYGIDVPLRRITGAEARARVPGFAAHGDSGVRRSDPGRDFDWPKFFAYTAQALTGSLTYAGETTQEDDMANVPQEDWEILKQQVSSLVNNVATKGDLGELPRKVVTEPFPYKDPVTGQDTGQTTTVATVLGFADFQATATRNLVQTGPAQIAADINAAGLAQQVRDELVKLLGGK